MTLNLQDLSPEDLTKAQEALDTLKSLGMMGPQVKKKKTTQKKKVPVKKTTRKKLPRKTNIGTPLPTSSPTPSPDPQLAHVESDVQDLTGTGSVMTISNDTSMSGDYPSPERRNGSIRLNTGETRPNYFIGSPNSRKSRTKKDIETDRLLAGNNEPSVRRPEVQKVRVMCVSCHKPYVTTANNVYKIKDGWHFTCIHCNEGHQR